ncbi:hypothetical protein [Rhodanobacter sp. OR444]|uniref:hypothetical protein n=1 Tax=Rhodanobacter sp. OR444 TaxID=1076525 RepID=UPI001C83B73C|nr:hypothetical protein [Rhodanobacter sp. OR444]
MRVRIALRTAIEARLRSMKMDGYPTRAYAEASPERINFLLAPDWGGETPRVLVIRADNSRHGVSGALPRRSSRKFHKADITHRTAHPAELRKLL